jgi:hypothetical protein
MGLSSLLQIMHMTHEFIETYVTTFVVELFSPRTHRWKSYLRSLVLKLHVLFHMNRR